VKLNTLENIHETKFGDHAFDEFTGHTRESGDSEDGEDDELPCVIGGESRRDCI